MKSLSVLRSGIVLCVGLMFPATAVGQCPPCTKDSDCGPEDGELSCFCGAIDLSGVERDRELIEGVPLSRKRKSNKTGRKDNARRGNTRRALSPKSKKCGKGDSDDGPKAENVGVCGGCPNSDIACNECTELGETCCDFGLCPTAATERQCECDDLEVTSCDMCDLNMSYTTAGETCCDDTEGMLTCPSCIDQHCMQCEDCTCFQGANIKCCEDGTRRQCPNGSCRTNLVRNRFRLLEDTTQFDAAPGQPQMIEHFLSDEESDPDAHFTQAQDVLPTEAMSRAVSFVEERFRAKESVHDEDLKEYKVIVKADTILDLLGEKNVRQILDLLYQHVGKEDQAVTSVFFQRFEHEGTTVSPYHTDGKAISLVILLNDDYEGGEMTYLTAGGPTVIDSVAGAATVHGPGVAHGNAAVKGIKYQLTFLTFPNTQKECMFAGLLDG